MTDSAQEMTSRDARWRAALPAALLCAALAVAVTGLVVGDVPAGACIAVLAPMVLAGLTALVALRRLRAERDRLAAGASRARRLADQDALTGVGNYRAFWRALRSECARAERHDAPFTLAVIDLDGFKGVNDEHGHRAGDDVLRAVADALGGEIRAEDALCRQGGDEFAVIAVAAGSAEATALAARLAGAVASIDVDPSLNWDPRASVGTATFGEAGETPDEIMEAAEASLVDAKAARHGRSGGIVPAVRPAGVGSATTRGRAAVPRQSTRLATLSSLARALSAARGERGVAESTVAHVAGAVDARSVAVLRCADPAGPAECLAAGGPPGEIRPTAVVGEPPLSDALRERRAVAASPPNGVGTRLVAPILVDGALWGAISVESERGGAYDQGDIALVEAMAGQMGRALAVNALLDRLATGGWDEAYGSAVAPADPHGRAVAELSSRVGERLGLRGEELRDLHVAALFHELGTVCAPAGLMLKRGHLTPEEFDVVRAHPLVGERLLGSLSGLAPAARIVRSERERFDGLGYPDGLAGKEIPLASRVLGACDAFVAMTSRRPYRPALSRAAAEEELRRGAGTQFDPEVVSALVETLAREAVRAQ